MEFLTTLKDYVLHLTTQDVSALVSAAANAGMAAGVLLAAKSLRVQKNVHLIDTHNRFQAEIRRLQERMPHDINGSRIVFEPEERRVVRLYWYAVVDEWFTCKVNNRSPEIQQLWTNFAWGAKSAIEHVPLFASELLALKCKNPYLLGTHQRFFTELAEFRRTTRAPGQPSEDKRRSCTFLFGSPCSGKSSVLRQLEKAGWNCLKIDDIVRHQALVQAKGEQQLTRESFTTYANAVCLAVYGSVIHSQASRTVVELGCLFPLEEGVRHLEGMLGLLDVQVHSFHLDISPSCASQRALARNKLIAEGQSDSVPISEPEDMSGFFAALHANLPEQAVRLPAEHLNAEAMAERIMAAVGS